MEIGELKSHTSSLELGHQLLLLFVHLAVLGSQDSKCLWELERKSLKSNLHESWNISRDIWSIKAFSPF